MKYDLLVYWYAFKWVFKINLGDLVYYKGNKYTVANGVRQGMWRLYEYENHDDGWVSRGDCKKVLGLKNLYHSFKSGVKFYRGYWVQIWKKEKKITVF